MPEWLVYLLVGLGALAALALLFLGRRSEALTGDRATNRGVVEQQAQTLRNPTSGFGL